MKQSRNLRIIISCVTFETVKITDPIKYYQADKVYLLHMGRKEPYTKFLNEVQRQLDELQILYESKDINILEFNDVVKEIIMILRNERMQGNHVYVNLSAGTRVFSAAGLIACMLEDGIPFDVRPDKFFLSEKKYYEKGRPVGLSKTVYDPVPIPEYRLTPPKEHLIIGLKVWRQVQSWSTKFQQTAVIKELEKLGYFTDIFKLDEHGKPRKQVNHSTIMKFKRNYLEVWLKEKWLEKQDRGEYIITDKGDQLLKIYGDLI